MSKHTTTLNRLTAESKGGFVITTDVFDWIIWEIASDSRENGLRVFQRAKIVDL